MHSFANQRCEASFSPCKKYRFWLAREWGVNGTFGVFLCHNPSSADALWLDPTTMRCNNLAVHWNWRGFGIVNLIPFITSDLAIARAATIRPDIATLNDDWLRRGRTVADVFVIAAGTEGQPDVIRVAQQLPLVPPCHAIRRNADGGYLHPSVVRDEKSFNAPETICFP